ncbi:MATE family efflux transporter [Tritonibacter scottomollicae]|uniref:Multidrug-efflux transporter n=1 Tax=Tritonibacter scottomollicae TaxID=483013 RepID=A0ABZ0HJJ3_TRISK|nr:MATE family efflux transporter [Tritonibacter scottomollicae]WOI34631.1 MATE family efflux transporter [Tritonibacter scottomollicae]
MANTPPVQMSYGGHVRALSILGLPLIGGHIAQFAIGLTDTVMLGWYGVAELAAVTLAQSFFFVWFILGAGFAFAVMPMVASAAARDDHRRIRRSTRMGLWLSVVYGALSTPLMWYSEAILLAAGQEPQVAADAGTYLRIAGWGIFPALLVMVLKSYLAGLERTQVVLWITVMAAVVNAVVNYVLIFGHLGLPEMGLQGAALASLATQSVSLLAVVGYALWRLPEHDLLRNLQRPDWEMMREIVRHGLPIGLTTLCEVSLFSASALMMGWLGTVPLAAHGIAVSVAGLTFMAHLGLSNAATIRVGNALGRSDKVHMVRGALVVTMASLLIAVATVLVFFLAPEPLILLFLDPDDPQKPEILAIGVTLLAMAGLFQLMDGMQAIALGLLRGLLDTGVPMVMAVLSYWAVGVPTSYILGFRFEMGGVGVWIGLILGLSTAGVLLLLRFWVHALKHMNMTPPGDLPPDMTAGPAA